VPDAAPPRRRRAAEEARAELLDAAEVLLAEGGPAAVRVQTVARAVGVTDAAVHYHFGSRQGLLDALLRSVARRLKADLGEVALGWAATGDVDPGALLARLDAAFGAAGYARLTAWMHLHGWRPTGAGMLRPLAEALHEARSDSADLEDSLHLVTLLCLVTWADALVGPEWRRAVGLPATGATGDRFRAWVTSLVEQHLTTAG
jgi:AcrR family transcriptional regulator